MYSSTGGVDSVVGEKMGGGILGVMFRSTDQENTRASRKEFHPPREEGEFVEHFFLTLILYCIIGGIVMSKHPRSERDSIQARRNFWHRAPLSISFLVVGAGGEDGELKMPDHNYIQLLPVPPKCSALHCLRHHVAS